MACHYGVRGATRKRIEQEIVQIRAGEAAERDAAYGIELYFGRSENWVTIHDSGSRSTAWLRRSTT